MRAAWSSTVFDCVTEEIGNTVQSCCNWMRCLIDSGDLPEHASVASAQSVLCYTALIEAIHTNSAFAGRCSLRFFLKGNNPRYYPITDD